MPYLTTQDGTEIYFKDWGSGMPVVLIHGWPLNADMWERQAGFLASSGYRVIAYDRRGFGRSSQPFNGYDYNTLADDLAELMSVLDLRGAALVGFSMGSGEVVRYLSRHGAARVAKAVLLAGSTPFPLKTEDNPHGSDAQLFDQLQAQIEKDRFSFLRDAASRFYGRSALHHTVSEAVLDWYFAMAIQGSPRAALQCMTSYSTTDFREEMKQLTTPFLVIHGTGDQNVPIETGGRASAKILPHAKFIEYEGEPHGLVTTAAERVNADLLEFLGGDRNTVPKLEQL